MALRYLLDENVRGPLWNAILRHNDAGGLFIDVLRVGDLPDLPLASPDVVILNWCGREVRLLVSLDYETLPGHLADHLAGGGSSPGILLIRPGASITEVVEVLELIGHAGEAAEYRDVSVTFLEIANARLRVWPRIVGECFRTPA